MTEVTNIILGALGVYGMATIVADYDGPFHIFERLRSGALRSLFICNVCLMPYFALVPTIGLGLGIYGYLAIVGGGVLLARLV